jgi:hypothetical protein
MVAIVDGLEDRGLLERRRVAYEQQIGSPLTRKSVNICSTCWNAFLRASA